MRFVACRVLFAVVLVALSCRTAMAQAGTQMLTLRGTVTDNQTRAPVASAVIQLVDSAGRPVVSTVSNTDGLYQISAPANTRYRMRVERLGYFTAERDIGRSNGPEVAMHLQISPQPILLDSMLVPGVPARERALGNTEQLLHGRLLDDRTREPIAGGTIELLTDNGRKLKTVTTDPYGLFRLVTPRPGSYVVRATRMGYRTADSPVLRTILGDTIRFNFNLLTDAVLLAPIVVTASARDIMNGRRDQAMMAEFYGRMAKFEKSGFGQFMTRDSLANYEEYYDTKYLLTHKFSIESGAHRRGSSCSGDHFYLNGGQFIPMDGLPPTDIFSPRSLEAIEVYRAPRIPAEFMSFGLPPCTVVAIWTRL